MATLSLGKAMSAEVGVLSGISVLMGTYWVR